LKRRQGLIKGLFSLCHSNNLKECTCLLPRIFESSTEALETAIYWNRSKKTETNGEETCEKGKPPRTNPATKSPHQEAKKESRIKIESFLGIARFFFLSK
jgi:hypothetical protein